MRYLITGGLGFIGSHLAETLLKRGDKVDIIDNFSRGNFNIGNLLEIQEVHRIIPYHLDILSPKMRDFPMERYDAVFHLAALISHRTALQNPFDYFNTDLMGTVNILEAVKKSKKKPIVFFASSNKVYGRLPNPWKEDMQPQPEGPYGLGKYFSEMACEMYNRYLDVPCVVGRYHHVAGARSSKDLVIAIFTDLALKGLPLEVHGSFDKKGKFTSCTANYTHVDDIVEATIRAVEKYKGFDIINFANPKVAVIDDMAHFIVSELNSKSEIKYVPMFPHETLNQTSNTSKLKKKLGFDPKIPVEKSIKDYLQWVKK